MNWRRGLLRLWFVVAILWVGFVVARAYPNLPPLKWVPGPATPEAVAASQVATCRDQYPPASDSYASCLQSSTPEAITAFCKDTSDKGGNSGGTKGYTNCLQFLSRHVTVLDEEAIALLIGKAISVPILLLLVGGIARWILLGFRQSLRP